MARSPVAVATSGRQTEGERQHHTKLSPPQTDRLRTIWKDVSCEIDASAERVQQSARIMSF